MGIIKSLETTGYKNLRFGKDRFNQGSSKQPYVVEDINDPSREVGRTGGPDFLIRGGTLVPKRVANDVSRLTKMFFDLKSPNGPLFTAKQQVLSLSGTNFKGGFETPDLSTANLSGFLKGGVYNPLSTIAQTVINPLGIHIPKQGLLPPILGPDKYEEYIGKGDDQKSRLLDLKDGKLSSNDQFLYEYLGGPKSIAGVGRTRIKRFDNTNTKEKGFLSYETLKNVGDRLESNPNAIIDFRQEPNGILVKDKVKTLNYNRPENRFEQRVRLGNPGERGKKRTDYQIGLGTALDKLNAMPLYRGEFHNSLGNDFVKFRIGVIDNAEPNKKTFIHFRAILDDLSDSYTAEWKSEKLMGRGEQFYRYNGFTRTVNLAWTVAAQSKQELIPMYQKLNYLASSLTPYYSDTGYMGGNLISLTLGGWFYEQPGILTGMTLSVPQESPWEIAIPSKENTAGGNQESSDNSIKELPHIIKVTGVQFIPIHKFVPKLQDNSYRGPSYVGTNDEYVFNRDGEEVSSRGNYLSKYGQERYIALSNGGDNNNYDKNNHLQQRKTDTRNVSSIQTQDVVTENQTSFETSGDINDLLK